MENLKWQICQPDHQWKIKGFIDNEKQLFSISNDTKVVSKILEIHMFPYILEFAKNCGFEVILPSHQNYYPDLSFVSKINPEIKYAIDLKTTYRNEKNPNFCNGFTLAPMGNILGIGNLVKTSNFLIRVIVGIFVIQNSK